MLATVLSESLRGAELRVDAATAVGHFSAPHELLPVAPQSSEKSLSSDENQPFHLLTRPQEHAGSGESNHD